MQSAPLQRARSIEQKQQRRAFILETAATHFQDVGFEKFSMSALGRLSGIAKGTLYLYFETREEVLLALCLEKLTAWKNRFSKSIACWVSDRAFVEEYYKAVTEDPELLQLISRIDSVIEHNVSLPVLIDAKRNMASLIFSISSLMADRLSLSDAEALDTNRSLAALLMGAIQGDLGPKLQGSELPEDVRQFMALFSSEQLFVTNACRIIKCIRSGDSYTNKGTAHD
ncbi:MAG: AcrR family transcriptional regulator [Flavobacterium sp.]|jgi:AcrR family transcriptional regulator